MRIAVFAAGWRTKCSVLSDGLSEAWVAAILKKQHHHFWYTCVVQILISFSSYLSLSHLLPTVYSGFQENQKLREQNDELNGQILSLSLYEAKTLFATQTKAQSLAAEIDNASRDQVKSRQDTIYTYMMRMHILFLSNCRAP